MSSDNQKHEKAFNEITFINEYNARIATHLRRTEHLIEFAENTFPKDTPSETKDDILRAAVVFLHATLEDFLRYIGSKYIPSSSEDVLNKISLIGSSDILRPEKFFLGKLAKHRGKKVDQLITESVAADLDKRSFSNTTDISQLLQSAGVPISEVEKYYPFLNELMTRRHEIVHRGDLKATANQKRERDAEPIDASKVREWYKTVFDFLTAIAAYKLGAGV
jgi:RiboL-PSP-HEPN